MTTQDEFDARSWLVSLAETRVNDIWDACRDRAKTLRQHNPGASNDALANLLIDDSAFWAAVVGVGVGAASSIPAVGQYIAIGAVAPELVYITKLEFDTALAIAAVYDSEVPSDMMTPMLLACLAYSLGHEFVKNVVKGAATNLSRRVIENVLKQSTLVAAKRIASSLGVEFTKKGLLRSVPFVAIPVNSALNYAGLQLFGKMAKHYFSPNWQMCPSCGNLQPRKNRFCSSCAAGLATT